MIYREMGFVAEVEVVSKTPKAYGKTDGIETTIKVLKVLNSPDRLKIIPKVGETFSVWLSNDPSASAYAGWHLGEY